MVGLTRVHKENLIQSALTVSLVLRRRGLCGILSAYGTLL